METKQEKWIVCLDVPTATIPGHIIKKAEPPHTPVAIIPKGPGQDRRAAFIVHAVNHFDEMRALLKRIVAKEEEIVDRARSEADDYVPNVEAGEWLDIVEDTRALLAKLEGRQ